MRRNTYVRLLSYPRPNLEITVPLSQLAKSGEATAMLEGRLLADVQISEGIQLQADFRRGVSADEEIASSPVVRLEPGYALTEDHIYQLVRIPPPMVAPGEKKPSFTVIHRSRFERLVEDLQKQMQDLEAPLTHVQALFRIHAAELGKARRDIINPLTNQTITAARLYDDFTELLHALRYHYATEPSERQKHNTDLWLGGHRVQAAVWNTIFIEQTFLLEKGYLSLFSEVFARLSRILKGVNYISTLRPEGAADDATPC